MAVRAYADDDLERRLAALEVVHSGKNMSAAVGELLDRLPAGPLVLVATCIEGAALAAACCAARPADTYWGLVNLTRRSDHNFHDKRVVVIEPFDAGLGWRHAVLQRFPTAEFAFPEGTIRSCSGLGFAAPER